MERIEKLLTELSLEEKVSLCAGSGPWHSTGVSRLGIPPLKVTDGPNGARGDLSSGCSAACFPVGSAMAATWNPELIGELGSALGEEARSKGAQLLLGPTVNIHRHPLGGRHFECYSEDPHLSARLAVAFVKGVQSQQVGACIKHFVCNDSEFERFTMSSEVTERPLREIYLLPFEAAVREAEVWSVMSAYNRVNGIYASSHRELLTGVLKEEWGFDGVVVSDWGAARETVENAMGGLDLEMPGPARAMGEKLLAAVRDGQVDEATVDDKVRRLLRLLIRSGRLDDPVEQAERSEDRPEHRALARRAAAEAMVLVKNEGVLPLEASALRRVAVIGPNAATGRIQGGGSSVVKPHYEVHPLAAIRERLGTEVEVVAHTGCFIDKYVLPIAPACLRSVVDDGEEGLKLEYRNGTGFDGPPVCEKVVTGCQRVWFGPPAEGVDPQHFTARYAGFFVPVSGGAHTFGLMSCGLSRLFLDDVLLIDNWENQEVGDGFFGQGSSERRATVELEANRPVALRVEFQRDDRSGLPGLPGLQFGAIGPDRQDDIEGAVAAAAEADAVILVVGTDSSWESEGHDRKSLALPGRQVELIEKVVAANPRAVVVLNAGSPVELDWLEGAPAVLQTWFAGQEFGNALAEVLFGDREPSGRLPTTWPVCLEDTPAYTNYPGENDRVLYGEGLFVGYRWYDARGIEPRLAFGHGLSYTQFEYGPLQLPLELAAGQELELSLELRNRGARRGQEVVQVYVSDPESRLVRPEQELRAFAKVELEPGETQTVRFTLGERALAYWDPAPSAWVAEPGEFEIRVGASSRDIRSRARFTLKD